MACFGARGYQLSPIFNPIHWNRCDCSAWNEWEWTYKLIHINKKTLKKYQKSSLTEKKTIICFPPKVYFSCKHWLVCRSFSDLNIPSMHISIPLEGGWWHWDPSLPSPSLSWVFLWHSPPFTEKRRQNQDDEITVDGSETPNNHRLDGAKTLINWLAAFLPSSSTPNHCAQSRSKRRWCQDPIVLKSSACLGVLFLFSFAGGENTTWW